MSNGGDATPQYLWERSPGIDLGSVVFACRGNQSSLQEKLSRPLSGGRRVSAGRERQYSWYEQLDIAVSSCSTFGFIHTRLDSPSSTCSYRALIVL
ncbi:hypothetical protein J6590_047778 [Homalodisca vitripennis]|nr:hypothetical protein J6590_047778 [Homalodisca vitripennis]